MTTRIRHALLAALAVGGLLAAPACSDDASEDAATASTTPFTPSPVTLVDGPGAVGTMAGADRFGTFLGLVDEAGLGDLVGVGGPWTIFAPDDAALAALDPTTLDGLRRDPPAARSFVLAHVVDGVWRTDALLGLDGSSLTSEAGTTLAVSVLNGTINLSGEPEGAVTVDPIDLPAANAVIHAVSAPLAPPV